MESTNLMYYRPKTIDEAVEHNFFLKKENKNPVYYSGGTEIITLSRLNLIKPGAFVDIKTIKPCLLYEFVEDTLVIGSALPLTYIEDQNSFPLLTAASKGVADHSARNKITLGGNVCGQIFYREAILPFLLCDSDVVIAGANGMEKVSIHKIFQGSFQLDEGQLLVQLHTNILYTQLPFVVMKKRQQWETGYPLITIAAIQVNRQLRFAFSGLCPFPFRSQKMETELNNTSLQVDERIHKAMAHLPSPILDDVEGSREYRLFVLQNTLKRIILELEGK